MTRIGLKEILQFGIAGQTLSHEAAQGRPDADGSVTVYDPRYDPTKTPNPITSGVAARSSVDTTANGVCGASQSDPTLVPMTSLTGVSVGQHLWITDQTTKQSERFEVGSLGTGQIHATAPLGFDYSSGAGVQSAGMTSPSIPTPWVSDVNNLGYDTGDYYAVWTYVVGGVTYRVRTSFDLSRAVPAWSDQKLHVLVERVYERFPPLRNFQFPDHPEGHVQVARAAVRDVVQMWRLRDVEPAKLRGGYDLQEWMFERRIACCLAETGVRPPNREMEVFVTERHSDWEEALTAFTEHKIPVPYDEDEDDIIEDNERYAMTVSLSK